MQLIKIASAFISTESLFFATGWKMSSKTAGSRGQSQQNKWAISAFTLLTALLLIPQPGNTKESKSNSNRLPPAPDTGSPEEDFSAGGTRDNRPKNTVCGVDEQEIAYLLGNKNREFTLDAYPTFWFHIPNAMNEVAQMRFVVTELETGKKIYDRVIEGTKRSGITGIDLPKEKQYALSPEVNYAWSLRVDCAQTDGESKIALEGWLTRLSSDSRLKNQLATASEVEKHKIYLKHNLLYDALTELAQRRIAEPNSIQTKTAWNELLTTLGWQDLIEQKFKICPSFIEDMQVSTNAARRE